MRGVRVRAGTLHGFYAIAVWSATAAGFLASIPRDATAQWARPPESGGRIASLGQPVRWRWQAGLAGGALLEGPSDRLLARTFIGTSHDLLSPVAGLAALGLEAYAGTRGDQLDGGVRALFRIPYLSMGVGGDLNLRDLIQDGSSPSTGARARGALDLLVTAHTPMRRGGIILRGGQLRVDWYPLREHSFTIGWFAPLREPLAGRGQPIREYGVVGADFQPAVLYRVSEPALNAALDSLRASAEWIRNFVAPFLDQDGRKAGIAVARTRRSSGRRATCC